LLDNLERQKVFFCLVGSYNYNLNDAGSDKDYRIFVLPSFEDLYFHKQYSYSHIGPDMDFTVHDIRKLAALLWRGNLNYLECLFSEEYHIEPGIWAQRMYEIIEHREDLARINLPALWNACQGMFANKFKLLTRATQGTRELVRKFGYDTKQAQHCYRCLDFLERFQQIDFASFKAALWYDEGPQRDLLRQIKQGFFTLDEFKALVLHKQKMVNKLAAGYKKMPPDHSRYEWLEEQIREMVRDSFRFEI